MGRKPGFKFTNAQKKKLSEAAKKWYRKKKLQEQKKSRLLSRIYADEEIKYILWSCFVFLFLVGIVSGAYYLITRMPEHCSVLNTIAHSFYITDGSLEYIDCSEQLLIDWSGFILWLIAVLVLTEIAFWLDDEKKPSNKSALFFAAELKTAILMVMACVVTSIYGFIVFAGVVVDFITRNFAGIIGVLGTIGYYLLLMFGVVGIIFIYIWLNSFKYRRD